MRTQSSRLAAVTGVLVIAFGAAGCGSSQPTSSAAPPVPAASAAAPAPSTTPAASVAPDVGSLVADDWSGFRGSADHSGVGSKGPVGKPILNWSFHAGGGVPNNISIAGDDAFFSSDDGVLHAVSWDSGVEQWSVTVPNPPLGGPSVMDGRVFVADAAGVVHAYDGATGKPAWTSGQTYANPGNLISTDGVVYFGTRDGFVVAVDAATGAERWKVNPPGANHVDNPAFANGKVYAGTDDAGYVAIDATTHRIVWQTDTGHVDTGSAAVIDGIAYLGVGADATSGTLRAYDAATGTLRWTAADQLLTFPTVADRIAYGASVNGLVDAIDTTTGKTVWQGKVDGFVRPSAVAGGVVYLPVDDEKRVYALDAKTGGKLWQFDVDGNNDCCIAVARGAVFVSTLSGTVYSIGGDGTAVTPQPFATTITAAPGPAPSAAPPAAPVLTTLAVKVAWTADLRGTGIEPINQIAVDPRGRIWAPEAGTDAFVILGPDGKRLEEWGASGSGPGQFTLRRKNGDGYGTLAFGRDGSFAVLDVGNRRVELFDAKRRFVRQWGSFGTGPGQYSDPVGIVVARDGTIWVLDDIRSVLEHYDRTGKVLGSFDPFSNAPRNDGSNGIAIDVAGRLYVTQIEPNQVAEFDGAGKLIRVFGTGLFTDQPTQMAIDAKGRLFVSQGGGSHPGGGILAFAADGRPLGAFGPNGVGDGQLAFPAGLALDGKGHLYAMDSLPQSARLMKIDLVKPLAG